jgi:hypothetical protein
VWNRSGKDLEKIQSIKDDIIRILKVDEQEIQYENFADTLSQSKLENEN